MGERENGSRATLIRPGPLDPSKSAMENVLELTALKDLGPVSLLQIFPLPKIPSPSLNSHTNLSLPTGHLYQHPTPLAPPRRPRHLRRRRDRAMPRRGAADGAPTLHDPQHALLLRAGGRLDAARAVPRRARARGQVLRDAHRAGAAARAAHLHHHPVVHAGGLGRRQDGQSRRSHARGHRAAGGGSRAPVPGAAGEGLGEPV